MRATMHPVSGYPRRPGTGPCLVMTTCEGDAPARTLARSIVEARLAACVQLFPVASVYRWRGEVESADEVAVHAKTDLTQVDALVAHIEAEHDYDVPEILVVPVAGGSERYLDWIVESVGSRG